MIRIFFLFFAFSLYCLENTAVTENDPSSFVEGVSMITGDFYTADEHPVIQEKYSLRVLVAGRQMFTMLVKTFSPNTKIG